MKKLLLLTFIGLCTTLILQAQQTHFGIKAGVNVASLDVDPGADIDSRTGLHFGGLAHIHINKNFAIQPELVFSMQGGETSNVKLKYNYLNVPILAQFMFGEGFRLQTGPQIGFLVGAEHKVGSVEVDVDDRLETVDVGWGLGMGYLFPQGIGIDARYNLGLTDIDEDDGYDVKNRVFQVGLFYQFMQHKATRKRR